MGTMWIGDVFPDINNKGVAYDTTFKELVRSFERFKEDGFQTDPAFQRAHVWTEHQQIAYIEWALSNGPSGRDFYINFPGYTGFSTLDPALAVLVDGKQRYEAIRKFVSGELKVKDGTIGFDDLAGYTGTGVRLHVADLRTWVDVLKWYLLLNQGGTPHTPAELQKVQGMLLVEERGHTSLGSKYCMSTEVLCSLIRFRDAAGPDVWVYLSRDLDVTGDYAIESVNNPSLWFGTFKTRERAVEFCKDFGLRIKKGTP